MKRSHCWNELKKKKQKTDEVPKCTASFWHLLPNAHCLASTEATGTAKTPSGAVHLLTALLRHPVLSKVNLSSTHKFNVSRLVAVGWTVSQFTSGCVAAADGSLVQRQAGDGVPQRTCFPFTFMRRCKCAKATWGYLAADCLCSAHPGVCVL